MSALRLRVREMVVKVMAEPTRAEASTSRNRMPTTYSVVNPAGGKVPVTRQCRYHIMVPTAAAAPSGRTTRWVVGTKGRMTAMAKAMASPGKAASTAGLSNHAYMFRTTPPRVNRS